MEGRRFPFPSGFRCRWVPGPDSMKETPLSNCERRFLLRAIEEKKVGGAGDVRLLGRPGRRQPSGLDAQAPGPRGGFVAPPPGFHFPVRVGRVPPPSEG